ncbi:MAG: hypothetical protein M3328_13315, partial [Chloroflexota bacterium]|nr:hypothetical protein [Chloroflexota bacterium]
MRSNLLRILSVLALLLLLLISGAPSSLATRYASSHQQNCTHPMRVGPWQGSFLTQLHFADEDETIDAWLTEDGGVDFQVACDGTVTADKFVNSPNVIQDEPHVETVLEISNFLLGSATCTLESDWKVENARLDLNESGSPRLVWAVRVIVISSKCEGEGPALEIAQSIWEDTTGGQSETRTFTWQDETPEIITGFMGGEKPWQGPLANTSMEELKKRFVVKKDLTTWSASFKGNVPPAPTATTEKGGPVVTGVTQQLEQFFLEKVTPVLNVYTASIDWGNEEPGQVTFHLGDVTTVGDLSGSSATAPIQIDNLPAGDNKLVVIATSAGGKSSVPFERIINVVPVPVWAIPAQFSATTKEGFVLYESTKPQPVPAQPANVQVTVPSFVPYVGGDWGLLPTQFQVNMAASSAGGLSNATVTGGGAVAVAGNVFPLTVRTDSFFRTNMTEVGLGFDDGSVKMELPEKTFTRKLGLLDVIPGATQILDTPVIGEPLKLLDLSVFTAQLRASLSGEGKLGVDGADLRFVDGSATTRVGVAVAGGPNISDVVFLQLIGTVDGALTLGLTPDIHPTACSISGSIFAWYGAFGFTGTYPNPPSAIQILSCDQFKQGGMVKLLAAPPTAPEPLRLPQRTNSWKPELVMDPPKQISSENGLTSATLVENVSALISTPRIAVGPGGRMAMVWVADVLERQRPQSFQTHLRLFDGKTWGPAIILSEDTRPDYFPSVALDRDGKAVVVWVQ